MLDVAADFPSVSQAFLLLLLWWLRLPLGFCLLVESLYCWNPVLDSDGSLLFVFLSGILQGCPLSDLLFTLVYNAFLNHIRFVIDVKGRGRSRACADDLGACLYDIRYLAHMRLALLAAQEYANLWLHSGKSFLVPCFPWSEALVAALRAELALAVSA